MWVLQAIILIAKLAYASGFGVSFIYVEWWIVFVPFYLIIIRAVLSLIITSFFEKEDLV